MDGNVGEVVVSNSDKYAGLVTQALDIVSQPLTGSWQDIAMQIIFKILALVSLGLPVAIVFFGEVWFVKVYIIEKYAHMEGIIAWLLSLLAVLIIVFPITAAILLPIVADLLNSAGVSG